MVTQPYNHIKPSRELILSNVRYGVISRNNSALLQTAPHRNFLDLAVIYVLFFTDNPEEQNIVTLTYGKIRRFHISVEELDRAAARNTDAVGFQIEPVSKAKNKNPLLYHLSNQANVFGAAVLLSPKWLTRLADLLKDDLYIVPFHIHGGILAIAKSKSKPEHLRTVLADMYADVMDVSCQLSNNIYIFDRHTATLKIAKKRIFSQGACFPS